MALRFLHLADVHLETSFGGRPETRERLREATLEAFASAVDYAIEQQLHAVLVAGDLYDDPVLSMRTELWLVQQVQRLAEAGVWFLLACGNHDPGGPGLRAARLGIEPGPETPENDWRQRVRCFREPTPERVTITDGHGNPVGEVVGAGHPSDREAQNLAARFPRVDSRLPVVGLLHTQVDTARSAERHERYAPSTDADYRGRLEYAYWALGHVHIRQQPIEGVPAFYAGNLQGRNARETGAKGGYVVEAHAGSAARPDFVRFGPVRWARLRIEDLPATDAVSTLAEALGQRIVAARQSSNEELAVRLELVGETPLARVLSDPAQREEIARILEDRSGGLEVQLRDAGLAPPIDRDALRRSPTVVAQALELIALARADDTVVADLAPEVLAHHSVDEERPAYLRSLLEGLEEELIQRAVARDRP